MSTHSLESLRERLLVGGVAPRHVQRYLRELGEHYDDARRAELERGADATAAAQAAWARLGSEDSLVESVLARPELRSKAARFPALVFGLGPMLAWLGIIVATVAAIALWVRQVAGVDGADRAEAAKPTWVLDAAQALCTVHLRLLPVVLGALVLFAAAGRRRRAHWPLAGSALLDVVAGTLTVQFFAKRLELNSSLLPFLAPFSDEFGPRDWLAFAEGFWRAACMLAISAALCAVSLRWSARQRGVPV